MDLSLGHFLAELLESTIHFDSKIFRTLGALLFRPGFLTQEYVGGRRQRYVPPIRLYVFVSVVFFFLLAVLPGGAQHSSARQENKLNLSFYSVDGRILAGMDEVQLDSVMTANGIERTAANRYVARKLAVIERGGLGEFAHLLLKTFSYMMFVLMPVFGFFVYLLYRRRALFYVRGLVYAVHLHCFIFLALSVFLVVGPLLPVFVLFGMEVAVVLVYGFLSLLRLFREPVGWTLLKASALSVLYLLAIAGCFLVGVLTSIVLF